MFDNIAGNRLLVVGWLGIGNSVEGVDIIWVGSDGSDVLLSFNVWKFRRTLTCFVIKDYKAEYPAWL